MNDKLNPHNSSTTPHSGEVHLRESDSVHLYDLYWRLREDLQGTWLVLFVLVLAVVVHILIDAF